MELSTDGFRRSASPTTGFDQERGERMRVTPTVFVLTGPGEERSAWSPVRRESVKLNLRVTGATAFKGRFGFMSGFYFSGFNDSVQRTH